MMQCLVDNYNYAIGEAKECWNLLQLSPIRTTPAQSINTSRGNGKESKTEVNERKQCVRNESIEESSSDNSKNRSNTDNSYRKHNARFISHRHGRRCWRKPVDVLHFLGTCSNCQLMIVVFAFRIFAIIFMSFCHRILPLLFGLDSLVFDTCQELYDDTRFAFLRNWDAVHFYHIAQHGYSHDNVCAFFPLVPMIIRAVNFVTSPQVLPILRVIAPVSLYVTLINITASCLGAVVLRNLTRMTFLESYVETHTQHDANSHKKEELEYKNTINKTLSDDSTNASNEMCHSITHEKENREHDEETEEMRQENKELSNNAEAEKKITSEMTQHEELCKNGTWLTSIKSETHSHDLSEQHVKEDSRSNLQENLNSNVLHEEHKTHLNCERLLNKAESNHVNKVIDESTNKSATCIQNTQSNGEKGALLDRFAAMTFALKESTVWQAYMESEHSITTKKHVPLRTVKAAKNADELHCQTTHKYTAENVTSANKARQEEKKENVAENFVYVRTGQRIVGGALLMWIISPAMIFSVVNYTESLFALFTMYGIYLINRSPPFIRKGMMNTLLAQNDKKGVHEHTASMNKETCKARWLYSRMCTFATYVGALSSKEELVATLCFVIACSIRSNAILCGGFLLYPMFLALVFPRECARRYYPHLSLTSSLHKVKHTSSSSSTKTTVATKTVANISVWSLPLIFVVCRLAVLIMECACIMIPYMLLNYHCWRTFAHTWTMEEQAKMSNGKFFRFYSLLQHRYWNVGFLTSYTIANLPNVLLALPITTLIFHGMELFYLRPILTLWLGREPTQEMLSTLHTLRVALVNLTRVKKCKLSDEHVEKEREKDAACGVLTQAAHNTWTVVKIVKEHLSCVLLSLYELICLLTQSCNVVYLGALTFIALTMMHIQVSTRFLSSCPAVYWFAGLQLALYPSSGISRLLIAYCAIYGLVGGVLFANHMPWT